MGRAVSVNGERHPHLTNSELPSCCRLDACICVKHFYVALIAQVYLSLVGDERRDIASDTNPGVPHLEAALTLLGLIFILSPNGSTNLWSRSSLLCRCLKESTYQACHHE